MEPSLSSVSAMLGRLNDVDAWFRFRPLFVISYGNYILPSVSPSSAVTCAFFFSFLIFFLGTVSFVHDFFVLFVGYAEAQLRQYQRLTRQIKPDMDNYERQREEW